MSYHNGKSEFGVGQVVNLRAGTDSPLYMRIIEIEPPAGQAKILRGVGYCRNYEVNLDRVSVERIGLMDRVKIRKLPKKPYLTFVKGSKDKTAVYFPFPEEKTPEPNLRDLDDVLDKEFSQIPEDWELNVPDEHSNQK